MVLRMVVGLALTAAAFAIAGRRVWWLKRLAFTGQPAPDRVAAVRAHPGRDDLRARAACPRRSSWLVTPSARPAGLR